MLHGQPRDHPPGRDDVRLISALAGERGQSVVRTCHAPVPACATSGEIRRRSCLVSNHFNQDRGFTNRDIFKLNRTAAPILDASVAGRRSLRGILFNPQKWSQAQSGCDNRHYRSQSNLVRTVPATTIPGKTRAKGRAATTSRALRVAQHMGGEVFVLIAPPPATLVSSP